MAGTTRRADLSLEKSSRYRAGAASIKQLVQIFKCAVKRSRLVSIPLMLALGVGLSACQTDSSFGPVMRNAPPPEPYSVGSYLEPGDKLKVIVYGEDTLTGAYEISPDGNLTMPLVGSVRAGGTTRRQLEMSLASAYASGHFLKDPRISIADVSYRPVYVLGEVSTPGRYVYVAGLDVLTAITTAGGFTYRADRSTVLIRHFGDPSWQKYPLSAPLPVAPGDLIRVTERFF